MIEALTHFQAGATLRKIQYMRNLIAFILALTAVVVCAENPKPALQSYSGSVEGQDDLHVGGTGTTGNSKPSGIVAESENKPARDVIISEPAIVTNTAPKLSEADRDEREVKRLDKAGNIAAAREYAMEALQRHPEDKELAAYVKMTAPPAKVGIDFQTVKTRAAELLSGMRQDAGAGGGEAVMASPIAWGAVNGAAARPPAIPAGGNAMVGNGRGTEALREAAGKLGLKDYVGAETILTLRLESAPQDVAAWRLRSLTRRRMKNFEGSSEDARRALGIDGRDTRSMHLLSRNLTDLGHPQEGLAEAERSLVINPKDADGYVARAAAFGALGRKEEELADLARAAALDAQFDSLYRETLAARGGTTPRISHIKPIWLGAIGAGLFFLTLGLFRLRGGDSSVALARREELVVPPATRLNAVPKGFSVVKTLGQGGMGVVYEAVDLGLQRTVALKKLRPEVSVNPRERGRFVKEARTVAGLKHPNIVEIHAIHEDEEGLFLVFERIPGQSLHDRLVGGALPPAEVVSYLRQIASALDYAHGQGVVHQDLKPANVMLNAGLAKVMDFGIARRVLETLSTMSKIEIAGTPAYMAPEQEQGVITPGADIFALGACSYEMLTGALPFPTGGLMLKSQKMYRRASEAAPSLPAAVDAAIGRALEPRPEDRWPTAASFVDALALALA